MKQFKRILSLVLAFTMLVSMFSVGIFSASAEDTGYVLGDADGNGKVNIFDVTHIQLHLAKYTEYQLVEGTAQYAAADADCNGKVNIFDVTSIQRYLAQYDDGYGIGEDKTFGGGEVVDPTTPSEDPTSSETTDGYYLVGSLNGVEYWDAASLSNDRKLLDADGDGIYTLDYTFYDGDEIKVVAFDGTEITRWYKDGTDPDCDKNYTLTDAGNKTGLCTVSFDPTGSQGWSYIYFTVKQKEVQPTDATEEPTTQDPTQGEASGDQQPTQVETEVPTEADGTPGYYMLGTLNGESYWNEAPFTADRKLNGPDADGNYTLDWTFVDGDEIKVVAYDGTIITRWYRDTEDVAELGHADNYKLTAEGNKTGLCTLTFNPDGNKDWSYTYFTVKQKVVEPTDAPATEEPTTEEPTTEEPTTEEPTTEEPTTEEPTTEEPTTEEPTTAPKADEGYYLVGTLDGANFWFVDDTAVDRKLADDDGDGIYTLDWTFVDGDEIKVVKYDGTTITRWYKDGNDPDGDKNYTLTEEGNKTGLCTVSFDPTGSQGWSYIYLTVKQKVVEPTDAPATEEPTVEETEQPTVEETEEPTQEETAAPTDAPASDDEPATDAPTEEPTVEETEEPTVEETEEPTQAGPAAGYYVMGTLNGKDCWSVESITEDRKLELQDDGTYYVEYTFYNNDEIKVVYFDGTAITTWYKGDGEPNYILTDAGNKTGLCYVQFSPDGGIGSYGFFTVKQIKPLETEAPTQGETIAPTGKTFYLFGYINGANYGCEGDYQNMGEYKFVDGTLTAKFDSDSYVAVKEADNANWYMFQSYVTANTGTLYNTNTGTAEKMLVKGGVEYTFTLVENADGSLTLSYAEAVEETEPEATEPEATEPEATEPEATEPEETEPEATEPEETEPEATEPEATEPEATEPEATEPEETEPEATEPEATEPEETEPEATEPEETEPEATEPEETAAPIEAGYYLVGTLNGEDKWFVDATASDRMLEANPGAEGEYMLKWTFVGGDEIKVVYFDGTEITRWYRGSEDVADLGDDNNYTIGKESNKVGPGTIYFNPNKNESWSYKYFTVIADTPAETEAPTEEELPTDGTEYEEPTQAETEEPTEAGPVAGYYLVGKTNGVEYWSVDDLTTDRLMTDEDGDGIYTLYWTTYNGDEYKAVYFDGTSFENWYPDTVENYKIGSASKTGYCLVQCSPDGKLTNSNKVFSINKA